MVFLWYLDYIFSPHRVKLWFEFWFGVFLCFYIHDVMVGVFGFICDSRCVFFVRRGVLGFLCV